MTFQYDVFTEEEASDITPEGTYQAEIMEFHTVDKYNNTMQSKSGIPMVKVVLSVTVPNGVKSMTDYILLNKQFAWKFRQFVDSIGRLKEYEDKTLTAAMIVGAMTFVSVTVQAAKDGYPMKNGVNGYAKEGDQVAVVTKPAESKEEFSDEIPF